MTRRALRRPGNIVRSLQLQRLKIRQDDCVLLASLLPSLTQLHCWLDSDTVVEDVASLAQLPNLVDLVVSAGVSTQGALTEQLLSLLKRGCTGLTKFTLSCSLSHPHMSKLLACLTKLRELTLWGIGRVDSLRFLSRGSITHTRTQLTLWRPTLHTTELEHVHALKKLRSSVIDHSFVEPLDPLVVFFYSRPYSTLLPKLTHFR